MKNRKINNNEKCVCTEATQKNTPEDELSWARVRLEELINERNGLLDKVTREEKQKDVLIDCLTKEHEQRIRAYEQTDWYCKRTEVYRKAIDEIAKKCYKVLEDGVNNSKSAEQLAKEILNVTNSF